MESYNGSGYDDTFKIVENPNYRLLGAMNNLIGLGNIDGRSGNDTLDFSGFSNGIIATLINGYINVVLSGVSSIECIIGGIGNDNLSGDNRRNILDGGPGDDVIFGLGGNDVLISGSGNNILNGGDGDDELWSETGFNSLFGGSGSDTAYISFGGGFIVPLLDIELFIYLKPDPVGKKESSFGEPINELRFVRVLIINVESGQKEVLSAPGFDAIILRLPSGNQVYFGILNGETANLTIIDRLDLDQQLPGMYQMITGIHIDLELNSKPDLQNQENMIISFVLPEVYDPNLFRILFWDTEMNQWVEIPTYYLPANLTGDFNRIYGYAIKAGKYILVIKGDNPDLITAQYSSKINLNMEKTQAEFFENDLKRYITEESFQEHFVPLTSFDEAKKSIFITRILRKKEQFCLVV
jgi:hypothetical protein